MVSPSSEDTDTTVNVGDITQFSMLHINITNGAYSIYDCDLPCSEFPFGNVYLNNTRPYYNKIAGQEVYGNFSFPTATSLRVNVHNSGTVVRVIGFK